MNTKLNMTILAAALASSLACNTAVAQDDRVRLRCDAEGRRDISMDARYQERRGRSRFDSSFEARRGGRFSEGDILPVVVAGVEVGQITLQVLVGGDVGGDLEFDSHPDEMNPFPDDFPEVARGTSVIVGPLGCALRN